MSNFNSGIGSSTRKQWTDTNYREIQQLDSFYVGQVMDDYDEQKRGRVWVYIDGISIARFDANAVPTYKGTTPDRDENGLDYDQKVRNGWIMVNPMMPFFGSDDYRNPNRVDNTSSINGQVNSYGMWVQPRVGDYVGILFAGGDPNSGFWCGMIPKPNRTYMVPSIPQINDDKSDCGDKSLSGMTATPSANGNLNPNQSYTDLSRSQNIAGVTNDVMRGAGTSGSGRESPSYVMGLKSAGWSYDSEQKSKDVNGEQFSNRQNELYDVNTTGHSITMDDHPDHQSMRFRTSNGAQLLFQDKASDPFIYIQTQTGGAWIEIADSGKISIFAESDINIHSEGDLNLSVDGNLNSHVKGNHQHKVDGDYNIEVNGSYTQFVNTDTIYSYNGELDFSISDNCRVNIQGDLDLNIDGESINKYESNHSTIIRGSKLEQVHGSKETTITGDESKVIANNKLTTVGNNYDLSVSNTIKTLSELNHIKVTTGMFIGSDENISIVSDTISVQTEGAYSHKSGGRVAIDGSTLWWNSGKSSDADGPEEAKDAINEDLPDPDTPTEPNAITMNIVQVGSGMGESTVPVIPQKQPWGGRAGIVGDSGLTNNITSQPVGSFSPQSYNNCCDRTALEPNLKTEKGSVSSLLPESFSLGGLFSDDLSDLLDVSFDKPKSESKSFIPALTSAIPFVSDNQGEKVKHETTRMSGFAETTEVKSLAPSDNILTYIKSQEPMTKYPKLDKLQKNLIVGYGHIVKVGDTIGGNLIIEDDIRKFKRLDNDWNKNFVITKEEACKFLEDEIKEIEQWADDNLENVELSQKQYDGMISFIHSIGLSNIQTDPKGIEYLNAMKEGSLGKAQQSMLQHSYVGSTVDCSVLERRRYEVGSYGQVYDKDGVINSGGQSVGYPPKFENGNVTISGFKMTKNVYNAILSAEDLFKNTSIPKGFLFALVSQESNFKANAKAPTSSAAGLCQFIKSTGKQYGLSTSRSSNSNVFDPFANAMAGARLSIDNYNALLNRGVSNPKDWPTALYAAHFFGIGRAVTFLKYHKQNPNMVVTSIRGYSKAIAANKWVFFEKNGKGRARTLEEVHQFFYKKVGKRVPLFSGVSGNVNTPGTILPSGEVIGGGTGFEGGTPIDSSNVGSGKITWKTGSRSPNFNNMNPRIRQIVEKSALEAGLNKMVFNSGYRSPAANKRAGGAKKSKHLQGIAIDLHIGWMTVSQKRAFIERLIVNGITGIGIGTNTIHADIRNAPRVTWKYRGGNKFAVDILKKYKFSGSGVR